MLLAIDIGNTSTHFGLFKGRRLIKEWKIKTSRISEYQKIRKRIAPPPYVGERIRKTVVSSVVPWANKIIKKKFPRAIFVNHRNIGLEIKVKNPSEVGADRLVNALAVYRLYGGPAIVVDFGTATTFDVVSKKGEYLGGVIAPGILLARDILYERTAKLPKVKIVAPKKVIGDRTVSALQSGLVFGYGVMVEGMITKIKSEILNSKSETNPKSQNPKSKSKVRVIATGGLAKLISKYTKIIEQVDPCLTLKGLRIAADFLD